MKKLLGILVLGLLWCNTNFAESTLPACQGKDNLQWSNCFGTYTWTSGEFAGDRYVGEWKDGKLHGQGTWTGTWEGIEGECTGEFKDDLLNGQAICAWANGATYVGEYKDDARHGQGTLTTRDRYKYVGEWKDGLPQGQGTETHPDGEKYVGEFKDGERHGQGTETFPDGSSGGKITKGIWNKNEFVEGKKQGCIKNDCVNGRGAYTYLDGSKYVGEFKDGKKHGKGIVTLANGKQHVAEFKDDRAVGNTLVAIDQRTVEERLNELHDSYEGKLPDCDYGVYDNEWTNCFGESWVRNAPLYTGEWKDGLPHGKGTYSWFRYNAARTEGYRLDYFSNYLYDEEYQEYVGVFENGIGQGTMIYHDGHIYIGEMRDGRLHGEGTFKCKNSIMYLDGSNVPCKPGRIITAIWKHGKLIDVLNINF